YGDQHGFRKSEEGRRSLELLDLFHNRNGSWNNITIQSILALAALHGLGLPRDDDRLVRGVAWLKQQAGADATGVRVRLFDSTVWSTTWDVRALLTSGEPCAQAGIVKALEWLLDNQSTEPQLGIMNRREGTPRTGAWSFQRNNETMVD